MAIWQKILVGVAALVVVAAIGVGGYLLGRRHLTAPTTFVASSTTPTYVPTTTSPSDLHIKEASNSSIDDLVVSSCVLNSSATSANATGAYLIIGHQLVPPNPNNSGGYYLGVEVFDGNGASVGMNYQLVATDTISAQDPWHIAVALSHGSSASYCVAGLFDQSGTQAIPGGGGALLP